MGVNRIKHKKKVFSGSLPHKKVLKDSDLNAFKKTGGKHCLNDSLKNQVAEWNHRLKRGEDFSTGKPIQKIIEEIQNES